MQCCRANKKYKTEQRRFFFLFSVFEHFAPISKRCSDGWKQWLWRAAPVMRLITLWPDFAAALVPYNNILLFQIYASTMHCVCFVLLWLWPSTFTHSLGVASVWRTMTLGTKYLALPVSRTLHETKQAQRLQNVWSIENLSYRFLGTGFLISRKWPKNVLHHIWCMGTANKDLQPLTTSSSIWHHCICQDGHGNVQHPNTILWQRW